MTSHGKELNDAIGAGQSSGRCLEKWAALMPWLVICYFAVQLCVRVIIASPLEVDDAEMVGQIDWALGYPNSHPPLYHWLVRICYDLFHSWPAATAFPKYGLLALGYILLYGAARKASGSALTGAIAVAFLFFIPVVCWKTQTKLTHSILGFTATAAVLHAFVCILLRPGWKAFTWLGCAMAMGLLAKYNFLFVLLALALPTLAVGEVRRKFMTAPAVLALVISFVLTLPHVLWIRAHPQSSMENLYRLQITGGPLGLNLRADSAWDGLISLLLVTIISAAPMLLVAVGAGLIFGRDRPLQGGHESRDAQLMRQLLGWMLLGELIIFIIAVFAGGFSMVHERYLVVLLPPLPLWMALVWRADHRPRASTLILIVAGALAVLITFETGLARVRAKEKQRTQALGITAASRRP